MPPAQPKEKRDLTLLYAAIATAILMGGLYYAQTWKKSQHFLAGRGSPSRAFVVQSWLVISDRVTGGSNASRSLVGRSSAQRLAAIDLQTGKLAAPVRLFESREPRCWPADGARIWCIEDGDLSVLSVPSFEVLGSMRDALARAGRKAATKWFAPTDAGIAVTLIDATAVVITPELKVEDFAGRAPDAERLPRRECRTSSTLETGSGLLEVTGSVSQRVVLGGKPPPDTAPKLIRAQLVETRAPDLILVQHFDSLAQTATRQLTRLDAKAETALWTMQPGPGDCQWIDRVGDTLVLATDSGANRALAIDAETGQVRWRFSFEE